MIKVSSFYFLNLQRAQTDKATLLMRKLVEDLGFEPCSLNLQVFLPYYHIAEEINVFAIHPSIHRFK